MPFSSGGSSSSGGVHSGGSSGGSGSIFGGSSYRSAINTSRNVMSHSRRSSSTHRYALYANNKIEYYYSNRKPEAPKATYAIIASVIFALVLAITFYSEVLPNINIPVNLRGTYNDNRLIISDDLKLLSEEDKLGLVDVCHDFYNTTGVTMGIVTVDYAEARNEYGSLERYAYAKYCSTYDDECHWLLVFGYDPIDNKWYFEGMQGDDTDHIISKSKANEFNILLDKQMLSRGIENVGQNLIKTFKECDINWMRMSFEPSDYELLLMYLVPGVFMFKFWLPIIFDYMLAKQRYSIYKKCVKCPSVATVKEDVCEYCNGLYVVGTVLNCPHCGANIPPHNN